MVKLPVSGPLTTILPLVEAGTIGLIEQEILAPWGFPGGAVVKNLPANAGDMGSSPGPGRSQVPRIN